MAAFQNRKLRLWRLLSAVLVALGLGLTMFTGNVVWLLLSAILALLFALAGYFFLALRIERQGFATHTIPDGSSNRVIPIRPTGSAVDLAPSSGVYTPDAAIESVPTRR